MTRITSTCLRLLAAALIYCLGHGAALAGSCSFPAPNALDCRMTNGARWEFSWSNDPKKGLILNQIILTPRLGAPRTLILEQASLAQVLVAYDNTVNSSLNQHHLAAGLPLLTLNDSADCPLNPGTNRLKNGGAGATLLCQLFLPRGYAWRGTGQVQGEQLVIFGASAAGGDTYIQQWIFSDDGSIQPMLGVSGQMDPARDSAAATGWPIGPASATRHATSRFHTAYWRLDFALGGQNNDLFQQLDYYPALGSTFFSQSITDVTTESKFVISPENHRFWLVKDKVISNAGNGQKIAFQIVPFHNAVHRGSDALTSADVYITQGGTNNACEQFATFNPANPAYGNNAPCAAGLAQFINGETLTDPVAWVGATWHQVPRAEDEANIQIHWQGIILAPRDLTATSPFN